MTAYYTTFNLTYNNDISDGYCKHNLIEHGGLSKFLNFSKNIEDSKFVVYVRNFENKFVFDEITANYILNNNIKILVFDYMEYGSPTLERDDYLHIIDVLGYKVEGQFLSQFNSDYGIEGNKLRKFFESASDKGLIHCYFKRELSKFINVLDCPFPVYPIDYMNLCVSKFNISLKSDFDSRPLDCFYTWGLSNINRQILHGNLISRPDLFGHRFLLTERQLEFHLDNNWKHGIAIFKSDWYERMDYPTYIPKSKSNIDLYGSGMKCFRNIESCINGLSFKQDPSLLLHAYPWEDNINCIFLPNKNNKLDIVAAIDIIHYRLKVNQGDLYRIYVESCKNVEKYENSTYTKDYIYPKIEKLLDIYKYE